MIVGLTALHGAGKGTMSELLISQGFRHFSARHDVLWPEVDRRQLPRDRDSLHLIANSFRQERGAEYVTRTLVEKALDSGTNAVVESFYTVREIAHAKAAAARLKVTFLLVAVEADREIRYARIQARASETDRVSFEEFCAKEQREVASSDPAQHNLHACRELADLVVLNNGTVDQFHRHTKARLEPFNIHLQV